MLLLDLRKHQKLANKRHPSFEQNRFGKFFLYFGVIFWIAYLIFASILLSFLFEDIFPNMEPYHIMNQGLIYIMIIDFLSRFALQRTPAQEMKPYLLLPIKKNKLLNAYLLQSGLKGYNLFWLILFVPFAFLTLFRFYGIEGIIFYCIGIRLLMILNNYWYLLCRLLINEKIYFIALPIIIYGLLGAIEFTCNHPISTFTMNLGEGFIEGNILPFAGTIIAILLMALIVRKVQTHYIYNELSKIKDTKAKHISEYKFLDRYGEIGEYFRLELKLIFRNKRGKISFRTGCLAIIMFSAILSFDTDMYSGVSGQSFVLAYCYAILGLMLTQIMSFEGNYLDGLMSRKESIYNLLRAKYYFYSFVALLPFLLLLPAVIMGKITLLSSIAYMFLSVGPVYCMLFQLAVFNKKTVNLNESITGKNSGGSFYQTLLTMAAFFLPMLINAILSPLFGVEVTQWIFIGLGITLILASPYWIKNVYNRFMKRRYENMEGFRSSR